MMANAIIPLVYGLLIGKSAQDYNLFFKKVLEQDSFQPESIMTDFETGTIKSVRDMLPNVQQCPNSVSSELMRNSELWKFT